MSELLTMQDLANGHLDVKALGEAANEDKVVTSRLGLEYASAPMASRIILEQGTIDAFLFLTKADLDIGNALGSDTPITLANDDFALVLDDETLNNNGYYKMQSGELVWLNLNASKQSLAEIELAKQAAISAAAIDATSKANAAIASVNNKVVLTSDLPLDIAQDSLGNAYRYTAADGSLNITGLQKSASVQDNINMLHNDVKRIPQFNPDLNLLNFTGGADEVYSFFDADAVLNVQKDIKIDGESLVDKNYNNAMLDRYTNALMHRYGKVKNLTVVATKDEDGRNKRMPSGIKTETGLVLFYHRQIKPYDGDAQGSEIWKAVLTIDDTTLTSTVVSRELFASPDLPEGIVKHPMLGRTTDNRILLMFEKRVGTADPYVQYQCYSSDEGLTFTTPTAVVINGTNPETAENRTTALGSTGTILTSNTGRIIVPMYNINGNCYVIYSDDDGINWTFGGLANKGVVGQEPAIAFDLNNNLLMTTRPAVAGVRDSYVSTDFGITWQVSDNEKLTTIRSQGNLYVDHKLQTIIQTHNETLTEGRTHYTWSISYDNGKTNPFKYLPYGVDWYGGYCQVLKYKDGVYILIIEYAEEFVNSNFNENVGVIILSIGEVISNVNYN